MTLKLDFAGCCWDLEGPGGQWKTCARVYLRAWSVQWRLLQVGLRMDVDESNRPSPVLTTSTTTTISVPRHAIPARRARTLDFVQTGSHTSYFGPVPCLSSTSHPMYTTSSPHVLRQIVGCEWSSDGVEARRLAKQARLLPN
ncbi:hypothetical protein B0H14DRAFT_2591934 [Mycena olivaceomarginata]|nr:hypothetical protein B0H14DRAFT_2591934 [Mycena olivaceomarginata]